MSCVPNGIAVVGRVEQAAIPIAARTDLRGRRVEQATGAGETGIGVNGLSEVDEKKWDGGGANAGHRKTHGCFTPG